MSKMSNMDRVYLAQFLAGEKPAGYPSPIAELLKAELVSCDAAAGTVTVAYVVDERFLNGAGVIFGGIITSMLDFAIALAGLSKVGLEDSVAVVELNSRFFKPVMPGHYTATANVEKMGGKIGFMLAVLNGPDGQDYARASAVIAIQRRKR